MANDKRKSTAIDIFRSTFLKDRHEFANRNGSSAFDQARTLYQCQRSGQHIVVNDGFYGVGLAPDIGGLMDSLSNEWWPSRSRFTGDDETLSLTAVCALYAHYLPEVGSDFVVEYQAADDADSIYCCWRVEANGRAHALRPPTDEGMFLAQTGTFYNVRGGLRWLGYAFSQVKELRVCEVESGLFVGVREGVPGDPDPASRPDEELAYAFSAHIDHGFDTVEFLGSAISEQYPFQSERYSEWLGDYVPAVVQGALDMFMLANSERFCDVVEEYCCLQEVEPAFASEDGGLTLTLAMGGLTTQLDLGGLFLRGLHTGRSFSGIVRDFIAPSVDTLLEAEELHNRLCDALHHFDVTVTEGTILVVSNDGEELGRWNLLTFVGRREGGQSHTVDDILRLMGFDPESKELLTDTVPLDTCAACGAPARLTKVVRPLIHLGVDPRMLVGVPIGDHMVYYNAVCPDHSIPVRPRPGLSLLDLEAAYQMRLEDSELTVLHHEQCSDEPEIHLFVGYDVGSLLLEARRVRALLDSIQYSMGGRCFAEAPFPDALIIGPAKLTEHNRRRFGLRASELIHRLFPGRLSPLGLMRPLDLNVDPIGRIEGIR